jgi:ABC-2 type transport system permease protein
MSVLAAASRLQLATFRRSAGDLMALVTAPLFTLIFLAIAANAGRTDLAPYAVVAPGIIAMLVMALLVAGEVIDRERWGGTLELALAAPAPLALVLLGRVATVTVVSLVGIVESWLVAYLSFGILVPIPHPFVFAASLAAAAVSMAGTSVVFAAVFIWTRSARTFQNSLSYPLFLLGGAMVPVALLPDVLHPVSRAVFLSWATDLLRDSLTAGPVDHVLPRLGAVLALGAVGYAAGFVLLTWVVNRARATGRVGYA